MNPRHTILLSLFATGLAGVAVGWARSDAAQPLPADLVSAAAPLELTAAPAATNARRTPASQRQEPSAKDALPPGLADALRAARDGASYDVRPHRSHPAGDALYEARCRAQGLHVGFAPAGLRVVADGGTAELRMELRGLGYGDEVQPVSEPSIDAAGQRIEYRRTTASGSAFTEWYENGAVGIEQGFTLESPPGARRAGEPLRIALECAGGFEGKLEAGSGAVAFASGDRAQALRYSGLYSYDATGRELPSRMELRGDELALVVDDQRARYPVTVDPLIVSETAMDRSDPEPFEQFGESVAISGDTAVVGCLRDLSGAGSAYVFQRNGSGWDQQAKLTGTGASYYFGSEVDISGDTIVVSGGSPGIQVFVRSGSTWTLQALLAANDGTWLRRAVIDGTTVAAADRTGDGVYVFELGTSWSQVAKFTASANLPRIGLSGNTLVASTQSYAPTYVFERSAGVWAQQATLPVSGYSVAVDGDTIVLCNHDVATVFERSAGGWTQQASLTPPSSSEYSSGWSGSAVALDGDVLAVGEPFARIGSDLAEAGVVFVFLRSGSTWSGGTFLTASDPQWADRFGTSVAIEDSEIVVGAPSEDYLGEPYPGRVRVYSVAQDPVSGIQALIDKVQALNLQNGITNSLDAKLDAAVDALSDVNENNDVAAINALTAFINAAQAQAGNQIPQADADALIADAQAIIALLQA